MIFIVCLYMYIPLAYTLIYESPIDRHDQFPMDNIHLCTLTLWKIFETDECSKKHSLVNNKDNTMRLYRRYIRLKGKRFSQEEFHLLFLKRA